MSARRIPLGLSSTSCARPGEEVVAADRVRVDAFYPDQLVLRDEEDWERLRDRMHEKNAAHADRIMRDLPKKWRDVIINRFKDLP